MGLHKSDKVLTFLKNHSNIHIGTIIGGRTSVDQPLDIIFNKQFKIRCKAACIRHTNTLLGYLEDTNNRQEQPEPNRSNLSLSTLTSNFTSLMFFS